MIIEASDKHGGYSKIALWKMDLKGAFTLLKIRPEDVHLMMYEMMGSLTLIHLAGMFGWTGMPFAFNVVTRVGLALIVTVIVGLAKMFVDDIIAVSPLDKMREDMTKTEGIVKQLLGPNAEEAEKRVTSEDLGNVRSVQEAGRHHWVGDMYGNRGGGAVDRSVDSKSPEGVIQFCVHR